MGLFSRKQNSSHDGHFAAVVEKMRRDYEGGRFGKVFGVRDSFGYNIGDSDMPRAEWFWFNAYGALAGIQMGLDPLQGRLAGYCGYATTSLDWNNPRERAAKEEIETASFG